MASTSSRPSPMPIRASPSSTSAGATTRAPGAGGPSSAGTAATSTPNLSLGPNTSGGPMPISPSMSGVASGIPSSSTATRLSSAEMRGTISKLQHENQSLKRRLRKYASTLSELSGHAKREIASSARARDSAIAAAADAAALRQTVQDMTMNKDRLERSVRDAHSQLSERNASLARLTEETTRLRTRVTDADSERAALRDARDAHSAAERRAVAAEAECRARAERISALEIRVKDTGDRIIAAERLSRELADAARGKEDLVQRAERASREVAAASQKDVHQRAHIQRLKEDIERLEGDTKKLRDIADERGRNLAAAEERARLSERDVGNMERRMRESDQKTRDSEIAMRRELDNAMRESAERAAQLTEARNNHARQVQAASQDIVEERDQLRVTVREQQEEIDQSAELLTRAAVDALADKGKIRKLEDALSKVKEQLASERQERVSRDTRISGLMEEVASYEAQVDDLRAAKRSLTDELHGMQLTLHEKEKAVAAKAKEVEDIGTERNDRAFHADRLGLELSNAKNALAKKESDHVQLSSEYNEVSEQLKSTAKDVEKLDVELGISRRELARSSNQLTQVMHERDRLKGSAEELVIARKQVSEMTSKIAERDEEVGTLRRWYNSVKSEVAESTREKKRLSDMLSDVSSDLQRANHELDLLREARKEQEELSQRIAAVSEQSTRELHVLKQVQVEQAERLARNTVDEYQRRMEAIQMTTRDDIANSVTTQLRQDIMPHLIRVVDSKARHMVRALARHVESFSLEDGGGSGMPEHPSLMDVSSDHKTLNDTTTDLDLDVHSPSHSQVHTNVATASGSTTSRGNVGLPSSTAASGSESAYRTDTPANNSAFLDSSRIDSIGSRHDETDDVDIDVPLCVPSRTATPTEGQSEIADVIPDDGSTRATTRAAVAAAAAAAAAAGVQGSEAGDDEKVFVDSSDDTHHGLRASVDGNEDDEKKREISVTEDGDGPPSETAAAVEGRAEDEGRSDGACTAEMAAELFGERNRDILAEACETETQEPSQSEDDEHSEMKRGDDGVEELDITDHMNAEDEDEEGAGVELEVEYDPRDPRLQGVFSSIVVDSAEEDNIGIGIRIVRPDEDDEEDFYGAVGPDDDDEEDDDEEVDLEEQVDTGPRDGTPHSSEHHFDEDGDDYGEEDEQSRDLGEDADMENIDDEGPRDLTDISESHTDGTGRSDDKDDDAQAQLTSKAERLLRVVSEVPADTNMHETELGGTDVKKDEEEPIEIARDYKYERNFNSGDDDGMDDEDEEGAQDDNHEDADADYETLEERHASVQRYVASLRAAGALNQAGPSSSATAASAAAAAAIYPYAQERSGYYDDSHGDQGDGEGDHPVDSDGYDRDSTPAAQDDVDDQDDSVVHDEDKHDEDKDEDEADHGYNNDDDRDVDMPGGATVADGTGALPDHLIAGEHDQHEEDPAAPGDGSIYDDGRYGMGGVDVDMNPPMGVALHDDADDDDEDEDADEDDDEHDGDQHDEDDDEHHGRGRAGDMDDEIEPSSAGLGLSGLGVGGVGLAAAVIGAGGMHEHYVNDDDLEIHHHHIHPEAADPSEPAEPTSGLVDTSSQMFPPSSHDNYDDAEYSEAEDVDDDGLRQATHDDDNEDDDVVEPTTGPEVPEPGPMSVPVPVPVPVPSVAPAGANTVMYVPDVLFTAHAADIDATKEVLDAQLMEPSSEHERDGEGEGEVEAEGEVGVGSTVDEGSLSAPPTISATVPHTYSPIATSASTPGMTAASASAAASPIVGPPPGMMLAPPPPPGDGRASV